MCFETQISFKIMIIECFLDSRRYDSPLQSDDDPFQILSD